MYSRLLGGAALGGAAGTLASSFYKDKTYTSKKSRAAHGLAGAVLGSFLLDGLTGAKGIGGISRAIHSAYFKRNPKAAAAYAEKHMSVKRAKDILGVPKRVKRKADIEVRYHTRKAVASEADSKLADRAWKTLQEQGWFSKLSAVDNPLVVVLSRPAIKQKLCIR